MSEGFFSRWSRRKEAVREGKSVEAEPRHAEPPPRPSPSGGGSLSSPPPPPKEGSSPLPPPLGEGRGGGAADQPRPPTLQDVHSLTPESDFTRFVQPDVAPEVKNAALKKLFADPHFNRMDGLDVYIDDYGQPDPLPAAMARKLASAQFLKLFDEPEENTKGGREVADNPAGETVAQSGDTGGQIEQAVPPGEHHADPDLRLQQDDAPGRPGPGPGAA